MKQLLMAGAVLLSVAAVAAAPASSDPGKKMIRIDQAAFQDTTHRKKPQQLPRKDSMPGKNRYPQDTSRRPWPDSTPRPTPPKE